MTAHRLPPRTAPRRARRSRSGRLRAAAAVAGVAALGTGLGVQGTFAFWTDSATVSSGSFTAGTLDITLNGQLGGTAGNGGTWNNTSFALSDMLPGESIAVSFPVRNNGSTPLVYAVSGTGSGDLAVTNGLRYSLTFGQTATNTGSAANGNRAGACGTPATDANTTVLTGAASSLAGDRSLAVNASETVCIVARLSSGAGNTLQGKTGSAALVFASRQPGT